jgi:hypothetical protein
MEGMGLPLLTGWAKVKYMIAKAKCMSKSSLPDKSSMPVLEY